MRANGGPTPLTETTPILFVLFVVSLSLCIYTTGHHFGIPFKVNNTGRCLKLEATSKCIPLC